MAALSTAASSLEKVVHCGVASPSFPADASRLSSAKSPLFAAVPSRSSSCCPGAALKASHVRGSQSRVAVRAQAPADGTESAGGEFEDGYTLVSDDPEELERAVRLMEIENAKLREQVQNRNKGAAAAADEQKSEFDPSRPRAGVAPPPQTQSPLQPGTPTASIASSFPASPASHAARPPAAKAATSAPPLPKGQATTPPSIPQPTGEVPAASVAAAAAAAAASTAPAPSGGVSESALASQRNATLERGSALASENQAYKKKTDKPISIVFVASEVAPYSKTGGLADVVGSLPVALAARGHRVMVVSPRYLDGVNNDRYKGAIDCDKRIDCFCFGGAQQVAFFHEFRDGVDFVFVDHPSYHRPGNPYGDSRGAFGDNQFRFTLLCHAACEAPLQLELGGFTYGQKVLFFANDWHAGLVPVLIASKYRKFNVYKDARCIIAIHNLSHQGVEPAYTFDNLGVPGDWYGALEWIFPTWARRHALDKGEAVNILKGAIVTSDRVVTVSPGYAWEITTKEGGWGLDGILRGRSFVLNGVTNGIDVDDWDPATDKAIAKPFTVDDLSGKAECKAALQQELGLQVRPDVPLIGFIGRLDWQKGPDILQAALPELMTDDVQFVMLGSGEPELESWMTWAESAYHDKFRGWVGFSVPVAHRITAGCDILLMPSRFEPCGLNQLYAMRYGTIPVVHATGGLRDTVEDFNPFANGGAGAGTGWTFSPLSKEAMMGAVWTAVKTYREYPDSWKGIMKRGMSQDMSWDRAASQYEQLFEWATTDPPYA